jgi:hypothetical protein
MTPQPTRFRLFTDRNPRRLRSAAGRGRRISGLSPVKAQRKPPDERAIIVEDLIKLLDGVSDALHRSRHPDRAASRKVATVLRAVAHDLEA